MSTTQIDFDSPEWRVLIRNLYAYAAVQFRQYHKKETNERGKSIHDYVSEAIEKHINGKDKFDESRSSLDYYSLLEHHLKKNIIRRLISNDLLPHTKRQYAQKKKEVVVETNLIPVPPKPKPRSTEPSGLGNYDTEILFDEISKRASGDHVVEQIILAIWLGGFELSNRLAICNEYNITQAEFDKGKRRFMTILGHVFKKLNWNIAEYDNRQGQ
jgi:hypothetical protein